MTFAEVLNVTAQTYLVTPGWIPCLTCGRRYDVHVGDDRQCLFDSSSFAPKRVEQVNEILKHTHNDVKNYMLACTRVNVEAQCTFAIATLYQLSSSRLLAESVLAHGY